MATLIGDGAHARDIFASIGAPPHWTRIPHHSLYTYDENTIIGINDPRERARVAEELQIVDLTWISESTHRGPDVYFGYGVHINYMASITRAHIGNHCTISPGATICGDVELGNRVLVGAGAIICDRVRIGHDVTIGAGAVVLPETRIPDGETWLGLPARAVRP